MWIFIELGYYEIRFEYEIMAYQPDEGQFEQHPFWDHAGEYASNNADTSFISEVAYMLVTLYRSEVP